MEAKTCPVCGRQFFKSKYLSRNNWDTKKYCSRKCYIIAMPKIENKGRFSKGNIPSNRSVWLFRELTPELSYIIGVYLGDGCVNVGQVLYRNKKDYCWKYEFSLGAIDKDFVDYTAKCLKKILGKDVMVHFQKAKNKKSQDIWRCSVANKDLCEWLKKITRNKQKIPYIIWNANNELKKYFLMGIMDSEGYVEKDKRPNHNYVSVGFSMQGLLPDQIVRLFQQIGVRHGKRGVDNRTFNGKKRSSSLIRYRLNTMDFIRSGLRFNIARKQKRLDDYASINNLNDYTPINSLVS